MQNSTVLVVDDDSEIRSSLKDVLTSRNYNVLTAENGEEALKVMEGIKRPCVVLLDLMMPVMNGWEFLSAYQKDPNLADVPVVVVSAIANSDTANGAAGFLRKPPKIEFLLKTVRQFCEGQLKPLSPVTDG